MKSITVATFLLLGLLANTIEVITQAEVDPNLSSDANPFFELNNIGNFYPSSFDLRQYYLKCSFPVYEEVPV